ncbi:MAG: hypothetical protein NVS4B13_03190 [Candidatus Elarobacter sp.]
MRSDYVVVRLGGYLSIERYPEFQPAFRGAGETLPVLVDLREGTGADSIFLSELLLFKRRHTQPLAVLIPRSGNLTRIFSVVGMGEKMNVYMELSDALRALGVGPD